MESRLVVFDANDLLELLKHYTAHTDSPIPIDARLREVGFHPALSRYIKFEVEGAWNAPEEFASGGMAPLHIRYQGRKTLTWGRRGSETIWVDGDDVRFG